jgi:hypothetical protein
MGESLDIFGIEPTKYDTLEKVKKENSALHKIWSIKQNWDNEWDGWKDVYYKDLPLQEMDEKAGEVQLALSGLPKEERKWKVTEFILENI